MFLLKKEKSALRWLNYQDFINIIVKPITCKSTNLFAFLTYNSSSYSINLINYFNQNSNNCTLLIVDNNSNDNESKIILNEIKKYENIWFVKSKYNLGSSGGNALIIEFFLNSDYENLILTEDDTVPCNNLKLLDFTDNLNKFDLINSNYINNRSISFSYHFTCYSKRLLAQVGVPDPRLFQGGDDYFFREKVNTIIAEHSYKKKILNQGYYHPTNKGRNTPAKIFLSSRNMILIGLSNYKFYDIIVRLVLLNSYIFKKLFYGKISIFIHGLLLFTTIKNINTIGFSYFKNQDLNQSLDDNLVFTINGININGYPPIYDDVSNFLNTEKAPIFTRKFSTSSLENIKNLIYIPFSTEIKVEKDFDFSLNSSKISYYKISIKERLITTISFLLSFFILPVTLLFFFIYFRIYFFKIEGCNVKK